MSVIDSFFMETAEKSFKDRLVEELGYRGLSKKEFAQKLGISLGTLGMYLYRGSIPSADVAVRMAQLLNTTAEYLVTGKSPPHSAFPRKSDAQSERRKREIVFIMDALTERQLACFLEIARSYRNALSAD